MKVILLCDVPKQGKKNEVINVSDGYGTNYLLKNNLAIIANNCNLHCLAKSEEKKKKNEAILIEQLNLVKEKLEKEEIEINVKTGKEDKMFGSVSVKQIVTKLNDLKYNVKKENIVIKEPINSLGSRIVEVVLHKKVIAKLKIKVRN